MQLIDDIFKIEEETESLLKRKIEEYETIVFGLENRVIELEEITETVIRAIASKVHSQKTKGDIQEILNRKKSLMYKMKEIEIYLNGEEND